jgi:tetratricopeptide (TPR) repeat protein
MIGIKPVKMWITSPGLFLALFLAAAPPWSADLQRARDTQNRIELGRIASQLSVIAAKQANDAEAQYQAALANSVLAEIAAEVRDKNQAQVAAEAGIKAAERAISLKPANAEYHRILGTLFGQEAAAVGGLGALRYGRSSLEEINKALELDPKASMNYLSRGIGNYYLPAALGGGVELAIKDFEKAITLDARSADAYLWLGLALRKANRDAEARKEFQKSIELNPARLWAKEQLAKTPAQ